MIWYCGYWYDSQPKSVQMHKAKCSLGRRIVERELQTWRINWSWLTSHLMLMSQPYAKHWTDMVSMQQNTTKELCNWSPRKHCSITILGKCLVHKWSDGRIVWITWHYVGHKNKMAYQHGNTIPTVTYGGGSVKVIMWYLCSPAGTVPYLS